MSGVAKIAMYWRDGTIKAEVIVDSEDYEWLSQYRWNLSGQGRYAARKAGQRSIYMHREIMGVTSREFEVDHINGDRLDNRRSNLRVVNHAENSQNAIKTRPNRYSQYRGVTWSRRAQVWKAQVHMAGRNYYLGSFDDEKEAAAAAAAFRAQHMPFSVMDEGAQPVSAVSRRPDKRRYYLFRGVSFCSRSVNRQWRARLEVAGRRVHLGRFHTAEDAARAYDQKAREVLGSRARLNFPEEVTAWPNATLTPSSAKAG